MQTALDDVRVLQLGASKAAAFAGSLLAGFGADVVELEVSPDGRSIIDEGAPRFRTWAGRGKRRVAWDAEHQLEGLEPLLAGADIILLSPVEPGAGDLLAPDRLRLGRAHLVVIHVSDFGPDGPLAGWAGGELILQAMSGLLGATGRFEDPPVQYGAPIAWYMTGAAAAMGALVALRERDQSGQGQQVDVAGLDMMTWAQAVYPLLPSFTGVVARRAGRAPNPEIAIYPASDGFLSVSIGRDGWDRVVALLDDPRLLDDEFRDTETRQANRELTARTLQEHFERDGKHAWFHRAQACGLAFAPVQDARDLADCPQLAARGFFEPPHAEAAPGTAGAAKTPGRPFVLSRTPWRTLPPAALDVPAASVDWAARKPRRERAAPGLPLSGVQVLELTTGWAGPLAGKLLADLGADVIRIESSTRPDIARGGNLTDCQVREAYWDEFGHFLMANTSKVHAALELTDERSLALCKRLAASADVVIENFTPRVLRKFGLDYEQLAHVNPGVVMASTCGFGHSGPWTGYKAVGWTLEPASGLTGITGYPDRAPVASSIPFPDTAAAIMLAYAVLVSLHHKERTGQGQWIDLAQYEAAVTAAVDPLLDYLATGRPWERRGNHDPVLAPHNVYPCLAGEDGLSADDDAWIAIAVGSDTEWERLLSAVGSGHLGRAQWATAAGRKQDEAALDAAIAAWTRSQHRHELAAKLQAAGVRAAAVARYDEVLRNGQLWHRGFLARVDHHLIGPRIVTGPCQRFERTPGRVRWPAPRFGQENELVLESLLGLSDDEYAGLVGSGVVDLSPRGLERPTLGAIPLAAQLAQGLARGADTTYAEWNRAGDVTPISGHAAFGWRPIAPAP